MATSKAKVTQKPLIQIDDEIREMTDAEYADYLLVESQNPPLPPELLG
jgi:hypothetical protein